MRWIEHGEVEAGVRFSAGDRERFYGGRRRPARAGYWRGGGGGGGGGGGSGPGARALPVPPLRHPRRSRRIRPGLLGRARGDRGRKRSRRRSRWGGDMLGLWASLLPR